MWLMYCSSFLWGCFKLIVYSHTSGGEGSDRMGNDRHVEEEPQSIQNSLRMVSCKFMLPLFWSSLILA
ncbi:hypothetical protein YC2023_024045 [Brassica napus]